MAALLHPALGPLHRQLGGLRLRLGRAIEASADHVGAGAGPLGHFLGAHAHERHLHAQVGAGLAETGDDFAQERGGPRAGRARDRHAGAQPQADAVERRRRGEPLGGEHGGEVTEVGALGGRLRGPAVHGLDVHERWVALVPPRGSHRAAHLVARAQLAAADLGGRDVHVLARMHRRVGAQERAAVRQDVEHPGDGLAFGLPARPRAPSRPRPRPPRRPRTPTGRRRARPRRRPDRPLRSGPAPAPRRRRSAALAPPPPAAHPARAPPRRPRRHPGRAGSRRRDRPCAWRGTPPRPAPTRLRGDRRGGSSRALCAGGRARGEEPYSEARAPRRADDSEPVSSTAPSTSCISRPSATSTLALSITATRSARARSARCAWSRRISSKAAR